MSLTTWTQKDERYDRMLSRNIKCPYCKNKIHKYEAACSQCHVTKAQILESSNLRAKEINREKTGEKVVMIKRKPDDVSFTVMVCWLLLGIFGAHNFYVGRKIRGWITLGLVLIFVAGAIFFPIGLPEYGIEMHSFRAVFENNNMLFPPDFCGAAAFFIWVWDFFNVVFGGYKYPVRLGESKQKVKT